MAARQQRERMPRTRWPQTRAEVKIARDGYGQHARTLSAGVGSGSTPIPRILVAGARQRRSVPQRRAPETPGSDQARPEAISRSSASTTRRVLIGLSHFVTLG